MADRTGIEWADASWNPIVGCSVVSPGCTNCYAMRQAHHIEVMQNRAEDSFEARRQSPYRGLTNPSKGGYVWNGKVRLAAKETLTLPLDWRRPRAVFVNSMGDLFHENVPDAWIDLVFAEMALASKHTFVALSKRAKRMRLYCVDPETPKRIAAWLGDGRHLVRWPLHNVILGVSAERQQEADERIPELLATPAAKRIVSAEPLLSGIDLRRISTGDRTWIDALTGHQSAASRKMAEAGGSIKGMLATIPAYALPMGSPGLDGIIVGGESGSGARPMHPDWVRSIRDQCAAADVPFFFKQWGHWAPHEISTDGSVNPPLPVPSKLDKAVRFENGAFRPARERETTITFFAPGLICAPVGRSRAGRRLDGREHNELPWTVHSQGFVAR
jgi:protein gp37